MTHDSARKSLTFTGKERVEVLCEPLPDGPGKGQILIETTRSLISSGTESILYTRNFAPGTHWDEWLKYPFRPGYLNAGRVLAVGAGVHGWKPGDRVASEAPHESVTIVEEYQATSIPDALSDEEACWLSLGRTTQIGVRAAGHVMGDNVAMVGLGLLGQLVTQYVRLLGADRVIAIDTSPSRLSMARAHGATDTLCMPACEALDAVKDLTGGRRADVVYDITGHPSAFATVLPLAKDHGTVVLLGDAGDPRRQTLTPDIVRRGVRIVGAHASHAPEQAEPHVRWCRPDIHALFFTYLLRGQIRVRDLITHRFVPDRAAEAYAMLQRERETAMGVLFEWK